MSDDIQKQELDDGTTAPPLFGRAVELTKPRSVAERYDVAQSVHHLSSYRYCAFALAICCLRLRRRLAKQGISFRGDAAHFSEAVFNYLIENGVSAPDIVSHGARAVAMCTDDLPGLLVPQGEGERREVVGNSDGTEG